MWFSIIMATLLMSCCIYAEKWTLFAPLDPKGMKFEGLTECPEAVNGVAGHSVEFTDDRYVDAQKTIAPGKIALFVLSIDSAEDTTRAMGFGANYYMLAFANGQPILNTWQYGNKPFIDYRKSEFIRNIKLKKGRNIIAVYVRHAKGAMTLGCGFTPDRDPVAEAPTPEHYDQILANIPRHGAERLLAERIITNGTLDIRTHIFWKYRNNHSAGKLSVCKDYPILHYMEGALDKILRELPATHPKDDEVVIWHLYNMGYVVKTGKSCFGIDINHRRGRELVPHLDFAMVTHMHADHFTHPFLNAMKQAGKPVISYFFDCETRLKLRADAKLKMPDDPKARQSPKFIQQYCQFVEPAEFVFGDVRVETAQSDHNAGLPKFITDYRITCGTGEHPLVIYHTGDSQRHDQLNPSGPIDVHINHPRVGMKEAKAAEKLRPKYVFFSHLLELGHCPPSPYTAFPFVWLNGDIQEVKALGCQGICPLWGEKFTFVNGRLQ